MALPVTSFYAAIAAVLLVALAIRIAVLRRYHQVGVGDGDVPAMARAVRVHGNATEYIPMSMLVLGLLEIQGGDFLLLHGFGVALLAGRLLHAWGLSRSIGVTWQRVSGMALTWIPLTAMAVWLLGIAFTSLP